MTKNEIAALTYDELQKLRNDYRAKSADKGKATREIKRRDAIVDKQYSRVDPFDRVPSVNAVERAKLQALLDDPMLFSAGQRAEGRRLAERYAKRNA